MLQYGGNPNYVPKRICVWQTRPTLESSSRVRPRRASTREVDKMIDRDFELNIARITHIASLPEPPDIPQRLDEGPPQSDRSSTVGGFHDYAEVS